MEDELCSEPESLDVTSDQEILSITDPVMEDELDQEVSAKANCREIMRWVHSFMGLHQIPDFDSSSSSLELNAFAGSRAQSTRKDDWLCRKLEKLNVTIAAGYPFRKAETALLLRDQFVKMPRTCQWYDMHTDKKNSLINQRCVTGHRIQPSSTVPSAGLPDTACLLPQLPSALTRTH